ncbi:MAG: exodeoxyribonuclease VII small subunit [Chitinispirillales bacterium]|jgi:exodeoxyribonuclease VII small subunit|nr:exodeoxyribonuclease VII small subunit [Chitinispirillales bacterium]
MSEKKEPSLEDSVKTLKDIISQIEDDDIHLDKAITLFSTGIDAVANCRKIIEDANGKITELKKGKNGKLIEEILDL